MKENGKERKSPKKKILEGLRDVTAHVSEIALYLLGGLLLGMVLQYLFWS